VSIITGDSDLKLRT